MAKLKTFLKVWIPAFAGMTIIMASIPALAYQEGYPATGAGVNSAQLRTNLDEMWQFGKKFFNAGTTSGYSLPYTGGRVCFGSTVYSVADGSADFSSYVNGNVVYVSIIESGGSAVLSKDLTAYNTNGIPLWRVTIGASSIASVTDDRTWVQKGSAATVKTTQSFPFEGIWATMGSNTDKFVIQRTSGNSQLVYNASYSGGAWAVMDSTKPQALLSFTGAGAVEFWTSPAGATCTWTEVMTMTPTGVNVLQPLSCSAPLSVSGTSSYLLLPSLTTTQRNALTAANGMIIYNTTTAQFERYENGGWVSGHELEAYHTGWMSAGSYSFTVPAGVSTVYVTGCGGGGGGGGGENNTAGSYGGGGGSGGAVIKQPLSVTPGNTYTITVGGAGTGGGTNGDGTAGGNTTFGALLTLGSGGGGRVSYTNGAGGTAGTVSLGNEVFNGNVGTTGSNSGGGGAGANSLYGKGGASPGLNGAGITATGYGAGGSGAGEGANRSSGLNGGNGTCGFMFVEW